MYLLFVFAAYVPFTNIRLATEEVNFEEDKFIHSEGFQSAGQSSCDTLHDCNRRRKQVNYIIILELTEIVLKYEEEHS